MEITEMTLEDLEQMKNTLYSDFDNFWSYNVLKQELVNDKTKYIMLSQNTKVKPEPELIEAILRKYGKVDVRRKDHNYQVTGKDNKNSSQEILFILEINSISC